MIITPDNPLYYHVLHQIAQQVEAAVVNMHMQVYFREVRPDAEHYEYNRKSRRDRVQSIRALIRSMDPAERRTSVKLIGYMFQESRQKHALEPRWQDYRAKCREAEAHRTTNARPVLTT